MEINMKIGEASKERSQRGAKRGDETVNLRRKPAL